MPRPNSVALTDEQRIEIIDAYTQTDEAVQSISARFAIKDTYIYNVLGKVGIDWRRGNPESFVTWQAQQGQARPTPEDLKAMPEVDNQGARRGHYAQQDQAAVSQFPASDSVPLETAKALENMLDTQHVLKPRPEPVAPTPAVERRVRTSPDTEMWAITVQGVVLMEAADLEDAIRQVRRAQPGLRIIKVELNQ